MHKIITRYRAAYHGLSPATWWLSLVMVVNRAGTMVVPFMSLYLTKRLGYSIDDAGVVVALFGVGAIGGGAIGGRLADRFGFHRVQVGALVGGGLLFMLLGQMRSYPAICACVLVLSAVNESFRPANSMAIAHYSLPENRTRSYSLNRLAINVGWAAGGSLGGFLAAHNYSLLFWIDGCTNLLGAAMLAILLRNYGREARATQAAKAAARPARNEALRDRPYMAFIVLTFLYAFCFFQLFSTQPVFYRDALHLPEEVIGMTMAANGILVALFEMVLVHGLERRNILRLICVGTLTVAASFAVYNIPLPAISVFALYDPILPALIIAVISLLFVTLGEMLSMPFMNTYWTARSTDTNRGQYAGWYTIAWAAAQVSGPYLGGKMAAHWGWMPLWACISGLCVISAVGYLALERFTASRAATKEQRADA